MLFLSTTERNISSVQQSLGVVQVEESERDVVWGSPSSLSSLHFFHSTRSTQFPHLHLLHSLHSTQTNNKETNN
jgi:hypothetical protein